MKNRNMFYQNTQASFNNPPMFIPPSGYNMSSEYQAYGPNVLPNQNMMMDNDFEERISKLERQIKSIDTRLQKIESSYSEDNSNNFYMI